MIVGGDAAPVCPVPVFATEGTIGAVVSLNFAAYEPDHTPRSGMYVRHVGIVPPTVSRSEVTSWIGYSSVNTNPSMNFA